MDIYVASKFENRDEVRRVQRILLDEGHVITHDWTGDNWDKAEELGMTVEEYAARCADCDFFGAAAADIVLLLVDHSLGKMQGAMVEAGIGLASGALVFCVMPAIGPRALSIFDKLAAWTTFDSLEGALETIRGMEESRRGLACR